MTAYYNEFDPFAAEWLRNLIKAGHIAPGDVDERSILDVKADDLKSYTQCHFFAGIGGWSLALRIAGWNDDRPVWTGSPPCQPFSSNGKKGGFNDERHLLPQWLELIRERKPSRIFGEQVAASIKDGWLDLLCEGLGDSGYEVAPAVLEGHIVGSPQGRERLYFAATSDASDGIDKTIGTQCAVGDMEDSPWKDVEWYTSSDGRKFCHKPGLSLLAHGFPFRVGRLRAYGNAIIPQLAAQFIKATM